MTLSELDRTRASSGELKRLEQALVSSLSSDCPINPERARGSSSEPRSSSEVVFGGRRISVHIVDEEVRTVLYGSIQVEPGLPTTPQYKMI